MLKVSHQYFFLHTFVREFVPEIAYSKNALPSLFTHVRYIIFPEKKKSESIRVGDIVRALYLHTHCLISICLYTDVSISLERKFKIE